MSFARMSLLTTRLQKRFAAPSLGDAFFAALAAARASTRRPTKLPTATTNDASKRYGKRTRAVLEILTHFEERYEEFQLAEALLEHDEYFSLWRSHHIKMVERMVGTKRGTGGSEGVGYLRTTLDKKFFPELWEARTYLDTKHGEAGCPFAKPESKLDDISASRSGTRRQLHPAAAKNQKTHDGKRTTTRATLQSEPARALGRRSRSTQGRRDEPERTVALC